ncbi:flagellar biosynthesis protein [Clostridium sp. SYSU_GA19001]|uniref:TIGR02530 family flagellar biosynthesis protein n=1 Tax=Clostridium caldaquaticum TaxID=2940653 RepID=UPI0020772958|nr:TIGR02530 family flagellar biosynthesis protein [Clostridium caldaquaticum]MCM8710976.1 flagellar biosynthesis protein [Clostridium caldaquaticum]
MSYRVINGKLYSLEDFSKYTAKENKNNNASFESILAKEINKKDSFSISNHAAERLRDRNIFLNESDMSKLNEGINKASEKGAKESLILYKDIVFVASIKNRTIITAVDKSSSKNNVFTNIDSVVLL